MRSSCVLRKGNITCGINHGPKKKAKRRLQVLGQINAFLWSEGMEFKTKVSICHILGMTKWAFNVGTGLKYFEGPHWSYEQLQLSNVGKSCHVLCAIQEHASQVLRPRNMVKWPRNYGKIEGKVADRWNVWRALWKRGGKHLIALSRLALVSCGYLVC
jgi:hypothetical protein